MGTYDFVVGAAFLLISPSLSYEKSISLKMKKTVMLRSLTYIGAAS